MVETVKTRSRVDGKLLGELRERHVHQLYRAWAPLYDKHMKETGHDIALEQLLNYLAHYFRGSVLLDPACGTGTAIDYLINRAAWSAENYPRIIVANDFSSAMLDYAKQKMGMATLETLLVCLDEMLHFARGTRWGERLERLAIRNGMVARGILPKVVFSRQDATTLTIPCAPDTVLCSYGFHWFLDKEAVAKRIVEMLVKGGTLISIEEWPIRVTPTNRINDLEERIMKTISPIPLNELYAMLGRL